MDKLESGNTAPLWGVVRTAAYSLGALFLAGAVVGFLVARFEDNRGLTIAAMAILAGLLGGAVFLGWLAVREVRRRAVEEPLTSRERLNRNILIACGVMGGVIGGALALAGGPDLPSGGVFSDKPLQPALAATLVIVVGLILPAIALYWHRHAIDEQEADAYKTGALAGLYLYMIGAPVWWFAWRGGFAPEPDGKVIYLATVFLVGGVWLWKKYR